MKRPYTTPSATAAIAPLTAMLGLSLALAACTTPGESKGEGTSPERPTVTSRDAALHAFDDCDQLRDYMTEAALEELVRERLYLYDALGGNNGGNNAASDGSASPSGNSNSGPSDYTTTNVQEQGVDEPDFVKTDGSFIYLVQGGRLQIVRSWPLADTALVGELALEGDPWAMFLKDDRVIVMSYAYDYSGEGDSFFRAWGGTRLTVIDVSDRAEPVALRHIDLEGWFADGRMIEGDVYMALNSWLPLPQALYERLQQNDLQGPQVAWDASDAERTRAADTWRELLRPHVEAALADTDIDDLIPRYRDARVGDEEATTTRPLMACEDVYRPANLTQRGMLSVVHLDLDDDQTTVATTGVLANGWQLYGSLDNLYVSFTSWWWWWGWGDTDALSTHIHKFELRSDDGHPRYTASGAVEGWLLDQFALSEHEGNLRVATTDNDWWFGTQDGALGANNVFVLQQQGAALDTIGALRGIAPGERITASRMMGDRGFLVTFRQTDPLFTLDLADPTAPRVVGELLIPGFSSYLHPMDGGYLLGIGRDGTEDGLNGAMQISIFDVNDFANPRLAHRYTLGEGDDQGYAWSEAEWDHHAFTFHRGVLSVPFSVWSYNDQEEFSGYAFGMLVLSVDADAGIRELGRVSHDDLADALPCPYANDPELSEEEIVWYCEDYATWSWEAQIRRSIYIEDALVTISTLGVRVSDLRTPAQTLTTAPLY